MVLNARIGLVCDRGENCWIHLKSQKGLEVKDSNMPGSGKGLYASKPFRKNSMIEEYTGEILNREQLDARYDQDELAVYAIQVYNNRFIDAMDPQYSSTARYMNDCRTAQSRAGLCGINAKIGGADRTGRIRLRATKDITAGSEIIGHYGAGLMFIELIHG